MNAHLQRLNLPTCTSAELSLVPPAPQNLTATVSHPQVTLAWDAAANAAAYDLWAWDSLERTWGQIAGALTAATYTHPVLADGRNYYFQVRARDANGLRSRWSQLAHAIIVPGRFPPPPPSLGLHIFYQKYLEVAGVVVVAPSEVSDEKMAQAREIVAAMLSGKPDLLENLHPKYIRVAIYKRNEKGEGISQLPEAKIFPPGVLGVLLLLLTDGLQPYRKWMSIAAILSTNLRTRYITQSSTSPAVASSGHGSVPCTTPQ